MSATNFKTENNTYRKLIGNGLTYRIPRFQRDYSWTDDEWEDLWMDILGTIQENGEPAHYMGYLVLQSQDEKSFDVIDGQQRLTTLTLIVLAALKNLQKLIENNNNSEQNQRRLEQIRQTYIGYLDPVTLISKTKLTLNRNNDHYFQTYLVPLGHLPQRGFRASEHSLRKAFEWFEKRVRDYAKKVSNDEGVALASLVETMSDKLFFTVISVTDELNAYKVFETLNARGVRLSSTDLLKNYLFSVLHREHEQHPHEMNTLEERWEAMVTRLGSESFPDFLRTHWLSRRSFVRQSELFKVIRAKVTTREAIFQLLREMEEDMDTYLALTNPEISQWSPTLKSYVQNLRMFSVRQPFPLLFAAHRKLSLEDFSTVLKSCVTISFRYNVIGSQPTHEQERLYYSIAQKITHDEITIAKATLEGLKAIYPNDETFKMAFSEKVIRTSNSRNLRVVRYILCELEKHSSGNDYDFESDSFNVEHILPQNPESGWDTFNDEEVEAMVYRLGNMTLLKKNANKNLGNEPFSIKKPVFSESQFELTRKIAEENADWTPERISARQKTLAKMATSVWRIAQLS
ncbi:MAG: DUF262 domain-containing HNH endonuclease family protein [Methylococcaceae bacterium]